VCAAGPGGANRTPPRARHPTAIVLVPHSRKGARPFHRRSNSSGSFPGAPAPPWPKRERDDGRDEDPEFMVLVVEEF
jgi:hypothetical protein